MQETFQIFDLLSRGSEYRMRYTLRCTFASSTAQCSPLLHFMQSTARGRSLLLRLCIAFAHAAACSQLKLVM